MYRLGIERKQEHHFAHSRNAEYNSIYISLQKTTLGMEHRSVTAKIRGGFDYKGATQEHFQGDGTVVYMLKPIELYSKARISFAVHK